MPLTADQAAHRASHIGASELAALFGLDDWMSKFQLWHLKKGNIQPEEMDEDTRVFWGNVLEPSIAQGMAQLHGWEIRKVEEYVRHPRVPGMGSSLDYVITNLGDKPVPLEIKAVDRSIFNDDSKWPDKTPPLKYQLQLQGQVACLGAERGFIGALVGGNYPAVFPFDRHEATIGRCEHEVEAFWKSIEANEPPSPEFDFDLPTIMKLLGRAEEGKIERFHDARLDYCAGRYKRAGQLEKLAKDLKSRYKAEILTAIQDVEEAYTERWKILAANRDEAQIEAHIRSAYRDFRIFPAKKSSPKRRK